MEGFDSKIDTEFSSGLVGGSSFCFGLFSKKVEHPCTKAM